MLETIPLSVLIVDDDLDTAESMVDLLTLYGCAARSALSGTDALRDAASDPPDVVIIDLWMPVMDGWELARQFGRAAKPPLLIALSGCDRAADRRHSEGAGIQLHLVKPVDPAVLVGVLRRFARAVAAPSPPRSERGPVVATVTACDRA